MDPLASHTRSTKDVYEDRYSHRIKFLSGGYLKGGNSLICDFFSFRWKLCESTACHFASSVSRDQYSVSHRSKEIKCLNYRD
jgi:hypothetical protein